jgi:hypothetical protein
MAIPDALEQHRVVARRPTAGVGARRNRRSG